MLVSIYVATNMTNGKSYVGKTIKSITKRWTEHRSAAHKGSQLFFHRAIRKYGDQSFRVFQIDEADSHEAGIDLEKFYIQLYGSHRPENGYNLTLGGDGVPANEATKAKKSAAMKALGIKPPGYSTKDTSQMNTPEAIAKRSAKQRGRPLSEAHRKALCVPKCRSPKKGVPVRTDVPTEELIRLYKEGMSTVQLGKKFDITRGAIAVRLKKSGTEMRPSRRPQKQLI